MSVSLALILSIASCALGGSDEPAPDGDARMDGLARFYDQALAWEECVDYATTTGESIIFRRASDAQCARLAVPLDYANPAGEVASVAVLRVAARGDAIGSLVFNPGGPGMSGLTGGLALSQGLADSRITERFDIVGFDPRGVGATQPAVDCYTEGGDADGDEAFEELGRLAPQLTGSETRAIVERCADGSGGMHALAQLGTRTTAKDMDVLRAVLGEEKLTFLGQSYGTRLGAVYAEEFPDRVRAMVLDGGIDPAQGKVERSLAAYEGFQVAFEAMAASCADQDDCPLGTDPAGWTAAFRAIVYPLREDPVPALDQELGPDEAIWAVSTGLTRPTTWPRIIDGLREIRRGRGDELMQLLHDYGARDADGTGPNTLEAQFAINCTDEERLTPEQGAELREAGYERAPFLDPGVDVTRGVRDPCEHWPVEPDLGIPYAQDVDGLPATLVVSITGDPTTPHEGAVNLARTLGSALLTVEGDGHTVVGTGRSPCVDELAAAYLIDLTVPDDGATCTL